MTKDKDAATQLLLFEVELEDLPLHEQLFRTEQGFRDLVHPDGPEDDDDA